MQGAMEWGVFSAISGIVAAAIMLSWSMRGMIAARDLDIQLLIKDVRHTKNNVAQQGIAAAETHDELIKLQAEVLRLARIVNGGAK